MYFAGIDAHAKYLRIAVVNKAGGAVVGETTIKSRDVEGLRTFLSRDFAVSVSMMTAAMVALFGAFIVLPQFARYTLGLEPLWIGAILLPGGAHQAASTPSASRTTSASASGAKGEARPAEATSSPKGAEPPHPHSAT